MPLREFCTAKIFWFEGFLRRAIKPLALAMPLRMPLCARLWGRSATTFGSLAFCARFYPSTREAPAVDLALKLNVLAVCAVFAFVGAILLGAF